MGEGPLQRVALWVIARSGCVACWLRGCGRIPLAVRMFWRRWRCVRLLCGWPNPPTRGLTALRCLCVFQRRCASMSSFRVCVVTAVPQGCGTVTSGMRGRTLRAHHVVIVDPLQHCAGWMVLACRRCGGLRACGVRHAVWMSLFLWLLVISVRISFLSYSPFDCLLVFSFNSIQLRKQGETMPSKRNRVQGGNAKGQASAVPQGDSRKRARSDLEGDTDQPAATPISVEEAQLRWTMCSTVRDILLDGETDISEMKLNDFLREHFGSRAAVEEEKNVDMWDFLESPDAHIKDQQLLEEISNLKDYQLLTDRRKLRDGSVHFLENWIEFKEKDTVTPLTRKKLNDALTQIQKEVARWEAEERTKRRAEEDVRQDTEEKTTKLVGFYESVYGAKWGHVLGFYDKKICEDRMEVHEGKPPQSWTYKKGLTFEKHDGVEQFSPPRPRLMVLTSDKGWPYSWRENKPIVDCYVNCEVDRVWRIVKEDLEELSGPNGAYRPSLRQRLLIGTPGIGNSMNAGSYLLYQLLHCDAEKIKVVVHCFGEGEAYVFDKTAKMVTKHVGSKASERVFSSFPQCGMKGYIIYDAPTNGSQLPIIFTPPVGWGTIVLASPKVRDAREFVRQRVSHLIIMNCPEEMDVKAMCAWMKRDETPQEQEKYWWMVCRQMIFLGPILRYIFDAKDFSKRYNELDRVLRSVKSRDDAKRITHGGVTTWFTGNPFCKLMYVKREKGKLGAEDFKTDLLSRHLADRVFFVTEKIAPLNEICNLQ
ncbi:retrotransposon hot spot protein (RHS) [Trypanosoma cruzi cruzi]|nr:retrotransposon hot spot protein (RHS) [Trypanosoma cruzi cruzi]